jgi:hypothetical protein
MISGDLIEHQQPKIGFKAGLDPSRFVNAPQIRFNDRNNGFLP